MVRRCQGIVIVVVGQVPRAGAGVKAVNPQRAGLRTRGSSEVDRHCGPWPASRVPPDRFHD